MFKDIVETAMLNGLLQVMITNHPKRIVIAESWFKDPLKNRSALWIKLTQGKGRAIKTMAAIKLAIEIKNRVEQPEERIVRVLGRIASKDSHFEDCARQIAKLILQEIAYSNFMSKRLTSLAINQLSYSVDVIPAEETVHIENWYRSVL